jgi:hypothetical protein
MLNWWCNTEQVGFKKLTYITKFILKKLGIVRMVKKFLWTLFILFNPLTPSGYSLTLPTAVTFGNLHVATQRVYVLRNTPTARSENFRM